MSKYLFIIESPNKKKYITKALGSDYKVLASVGHIRDLPEKKLSVDLKKKFKPTYEVYADKKQVVDEIVKEAKKQVSSISEPTPTAKERELLGTFQS